MSTLWVNRIGLEPQVSKGGKSTLCAGCGHNAISERIFEAFYEMGVDPSQMIKLSGIGCSSKSPAYFLGTAHGFNAVHGRMPSLATGAIGIGQFVHLMRRNIPMLYIIEDNGCYGLTKGQFSPTADIGSRLKTGAVNDLPPLDLCALAHKGTAMIDVLSPCVTFNDHEGSTKSYADVKQHDERLEDVTFVPFFEDISVDYEPTDQINALTHLTEASRRAEYPTGLVYIEPDREDFLDQLNVVEEPLANLGLDRTPPSRAALAEIIDALR